MNYKKAFGFLFDISAYFVILAIILIQKDSKKTVLVEIFGDGILIYFIYFILLRELYKLMGWRKYFNSATVPKKK